MLSTIYDGRAVLVLVGAGDGMEGRMNGRAGANMQQPIEMRIGILAQK